MKEYKFPEITQLDQLNEDSFEYSYSDYMKWRFQERVEIIMGKIFPMSAPTTLHQHIIGELFFTMYAFFKHTSCNVILSPIDVRLPVGKQGKNFKTVMQPDLCVICDKSKIVAQGIIGAPDLVVEILSPSNRQIEMHEKFEAYQASLVREYWIIHPWEQWMLQYVLNENNLYELHKKYENLSRLESVIFLNLVVDVAAFKP
ncbi:MAG: Uma2 family endonuclease [Haliscomenobacter sp.]|nr:Uma2 family endonuclease [Haliscomenobacter sp.]